MPLPAPSRDRRLACLTRILSEAAVPSQEELVRHLAEAGHEVTQSSVSRDLKEIGAVKTRSGYSLPSAGEVVAIGPGRARRLPWLAAVKSLVGAGPNLLVLRTLTGAAPQVGLGVDGLAWTEIAGTVAGDDTLLIAVADEGRAALLTRMAELGLSLQGSGGASDG